MRRLRFTAVALVILLALSLAGCTKIWSYRFFFYNSMVDNWDF